ncbi:adenine nucleotide alpha hydrolase [Labrys monachus]|uniref:Adenine nucleotide alpha hydrolase n=1 Tax=Labrys monachus TaxID=217067 RepID=A0ABU0FA63_9HYPH|nr:adenine nucleotide alpha hydrolase [Labrys monachus]MDQ0391512.1 uncharacterized protein [Labrys monachus]
MTDSLERLEAILPGLGSVAIALSGGVDSMTLATVAHRLLGRDRVRMMHAVSPAVPPPATARVREIAAAEAWDLQILDAGEFADPRYRANPYNRCFFCKTNLYGAIAGRTDRQVLSGTNVDDLGEYRPGLQAAREHGVRHPFVEADMRKADVRAAARRLGLGAVAELPASPCLSSRVETGIPIDPATLVFAHEVEQFVTAEIAPATVRCRVRPSAVVVELDRESLDAMASEARRAMEEAIGAMRPAATRGLPVTFAAYRTGSAFVDRSRP